LRPRNEKATNRIYRRAARVDKIQGTAKEAAGKAKEVAGRTIGNQDLVASGIAEITEGGVQKKVGDVKKAFGK
jgi:uncharacterized protein YjbJ (UPF0337 family)